MDFFKHNISWVVAFVLAVFLVGGYESLCAAPISFSSGTIVNIEKGASAPTAAQELSRAHVIAHPSVLLFVLRVMGKSTSVQAGAYRFQAPQSVFTVANRLVAAAYDLSPARITFIEGATVREMAAQVAAALPLISTKDFIAAGQPYEGYLFPDTYFFPPSADTASIIAMMRANFDTKTIPLSADIRASGHSLSDTVIMASLVEKEARTSAVRHVVAGILWNRLRLKMPLQVDAVFGYIYNRDTYSPSLTDLKIDSPYNTYTHIGLPPGPIGNPGLDSLDAAVHPTKTDYLYYLVDKNGVIHYATTFAGHQVNQRKYLGN